MIKLDHCWFTWHHHRLLVVVLVRSISGGDGSVKVKTTLLLMLLGLCTASALVASLASPKVVLNMWRRHIVVNAMRKHRRRCGRRRRRFQRWLSGGGLREHIWTNHKYILVNIRVGLGAATRLATIHLATRSPSVQSMRTLGDPHFFYFLNHRFFSNKNFFNQIFFQPKNFFNLIFFQQKFF